MANRFTQFSPQEYQNTFVETPIVDPGFQEMFQLKKYQADKQDLFDANLGKAQAYSTPSGIMTRDVARDIDAKKNAELMRISESMASGNMGQRDATIAMNRINTAYQNDRLRQAAIRDSEYEKEVNKVRMDPNYGKDVFIPNLDSEERKQKYIDNIKNGSIEFDPAHAYAAITNPGPDVAFKELLKVKPDQVTMEVISADGTKKMVSMDGTLDMPTVLKRVMPYYSQISSDGINFDRLNDAGVDPDIRKWIEATSLAREKDGLPAYKFPDFISDMEDYAGLSLNVKTSDKIGSTPRSSGNKKTAAEESGYSETSLGETLETGVRPTSTDVVTANDREKIKVAARVSGTNPNNFTTKETNQNVYRYNVQSFSNDPIAADGTAGKTAREKHYEFLKDEQSKTYEAIHKDNMDKREKAASVVTIDGKEVKTYQTDESTIADNSWKETLAVMESRKAYATALKQTVMDPTLKGAVPKISSNGISFEDKIDSKEQAIINDYNKVIKDTKEAWSKSKFKDPYQEGNLQPPSGFAILNGELVPNRIYDKYKGFYEKLNGNLTTQFGNKKYTTEHFLLPKTNEAGEFAKGDVPEYMKNIITAARINGRGESDKIYRNGKKLNGFTASSGNVGETKNDLYTTEPIGTFDINLKKLGQEFKTHDFSNGDFIPESRYYDNTANKWFAKGYYEVKDGDAFVKSQSYHVDITEAVYSAIGGDEQFKTELNDIALDALNIENGESVFLDLGQKEFTEGKYSPVMVTRRLNGNYEMSGEYFNTTTGKKESVRDALRDDYKVDPSNLSKKQAAEYGARIVGNQMKFKDGEENPYQSNKSPVTPDKLKDILDNPRLVPATINNLNYVFNTINKVESASMGDYDAMNQGGTDGGRKAIGSANSKDVLPKPLSQMTVGEVMEYQARDSTDKLNVHAAGKFQITPLTLTGLVNNGVVSPNDVFDEKTQYKAALGLLAGRLKKASSDKEIVDEISTEWVGLENIFNDPKKKDEADQLLNYVKQIKAQLNL